MVRARSLGILILGLGAAVWAASPLDGNYTLDKSRSADVDKAVEATVEQLNFMIRPVARSRLAKPNTPSPRVCIAVGDRAQIELGARIVSAPLDGQAVSWSRLDGEVLQVSIRQSGERLVETFQGADGSRRNTFTLLDGGKALAMDVQLESPKLPEPLRYRLVYSRTP